MMRLKRIAIMVLPVLFVAGCFIQPMFAGNVRPYEIGLYWDGDVRPYVVGLYWDEECMHPVTSLDCGTLARGHETSVTFWLRSESSDKGRIRWALANVHPSTVGITGRWERRVDEFTYLSNWHKKMKPGDLWTVRYTIHVAQDTQVGTYSWELEIYHTSHKSSVSCMIAACVLTVT